MKAQFIHLEEYTLGKGKRGRPDVSGVLMEAGRVITHCKHVNDPREPLQLYGLTPLAVEKEITDAAKKIAKNGRAVRKDSKVIIAGVASYPEKVGEVTDSKRLEEWTRATLDFLKLEFGASFRSAIMHLDEEYPHIHFYAYNQKNLKIDTIHPAYKAKAAEKVKRKKQNAFKKGLTQFSDRYFFEVSEKLGHERHRDRRKRLERDEYLERKALIERERAKMAEVKEKFEFMYQEKVNECNDLNFKISKLNKRIVKMLTVINTLKGKFRNTFSYSNLHRN